MACIQFCDYAKRTFFQNCGFWLQIYDSMTTLISFGFFTVTLIISIPVAMRE